MFTVTLPLKQGNTQQVAREEIMVDLAARTQLQGIRVLLAYVASYAPVRDQTSPRHATHSWGTPGVARRSAGLSGVLKDPAKSE